MQVEVVDTLEGLAGLREEWEDLERRDPQCSFYLTHRFVTAWSQAYHDDPGTELHIVVVRHNNRVVAVMPLAVRPGRRRGRPIRTLRYASHGDFMGALVDPSESADAICRVLLEAVDRPDRWDGINLSNVSVDTALGHFLLKTGHNPQFTPHVEAPYIALRDYTDFEDFCRRSLPSHTRKYRNKLLREHDVTFRVFTGDEDGVLDRIAAVHRAERDHLVENRSREERHSLFDDERRMALVRTVFGAGDDAVTFAYEDAAGRIVGYRTCYRQGRTLLSWNSAYDPAFEPYRLGKVIQFDILEHLYAEDSVDVFDFGAGRYPWKFEWTPRFTPTYRYQRRLNPDPPPEPKPKPAPVSPAPAPAPAPAPVPPAPPVPQPATPSGHRGGHRGGPTHGARRLAGAVARRAGVPALRRGLAETAARARGRLQPPVIWYIPHPDDETIFMGGSIHRHRHRRTVLAVLTPGGASVALKRVNARLDEPLTVEDFMQGRLDEFAAAVTALGLAPRHVQQHRLTDGGVTVAGVSAVIEDMARRHPGATHHTMSYLDPHPDHRAAGQALRQAHAAGVVEHAVFHLPVPVVPATMGERAPLSVADVEAKRSALREYQRWEPTKGRFAIGEHSVRSLIAQQLERPVERVHDTTYEG